MSGCLSSVCLSFWLCVCLSVRPSVRASVWSLSTCLPACLSACTTHNQKTKDLKNFEKTMCAIATLHRYYSSSCMPFYDKNTQFLFRSEHGWHCESSYNFWDSLCSRAHENGSTPSTFELNQLHVNGLILQIWREKEALPDRWTNSMLE